MVEWPVIIDVIILAHFPALVVVQTEGSVRMQPLLPCPLKPDNIIGVHVGRYPLQDRKSKIPRIALTKQTVSAVAGGRIVSPPAKHIVFSIRGTDVTLPVSGVTDVVDASPLRERRAP